MAGKEEKVEMTGEIVEALRNGMFRIALDNGHETLGYTAGKMRRFPVRMKPGERGRLEPSAYDLHPRPVVYPPPPGRPPAEAPPPAARPSGGKLRPRRVAFGRGTSETGRRAACRLCASRRGSRTGVDPGRLGLVADRRVDHDSGAPRAATACR